MYLDLLKKFHIEICANNWPFTKEVRDTLHGLPLTDWGILVIYLSRPGWTNYSKPQGRNHWSATASAWAEASETSSYSHGAVRPEQPTLPTPPPPMMMRSPGGHQAAPHLQWSATIIPMLIDSTAGTEHHLRRRRRRRQQKIIKTRIKITASHPANADTASNTQLTFITNNSTLWVKCNTPIKS